MAKKLTEYDHQLRKLVLEHDGVQALIAQDLGISVRTLYGRLHSEKHHTWWQRFKKARSKRRKRINNARQYQARKARAAGEALGAEVTLQERP